MRQRKGSPWAGVGVVATKEMADHFSSARMRTLEWLIVLTAGASLYGVFRHIRAAASEDPFVFLHLFTASQGAMPSFAAAMAGASRRMAAPSPTARS